MEVSGGPYDPRAIANLMLDEADRSGIQVTNLALQKLLYFAHSIFLIEAKRPLVSGYFEAWQYGPVHPTAYSAFKTVGGSPIDFRATGKNVMTGERIVLDLPEDLTVRRHLARIMSSYGQLSPGRLVDISHAKGAPWDFIVDKGRTSVALGLRIPDAVIIDRFKYHKVSVGVAPVMGEPDEDTPLT
ncbi:type VI toxin-antitoxin system SocA family antitoxin [Brucella vulpis]|uniref:type VI toxin-antitoxin system SocA family antitoxin n=1 Tax=Brucella vulpis TaxID=981386 RepID=UPI0007444B86